MNVFVITEDHTTDWLMLEPILQTMMKVAGKPKAKLRVNQEGSKGVAAVLEWNNIRDILEERQSFTDLFLLCVDRDGVETRINKLERLEKEARKVLVPSKGFFAVNAWQEIEVWLLAGHDLPSDWHWGQVRQVLNPKEMYYLDFAKRKGVYDLPHEGRRKLALEAKYKKVNSRCQEINALEKRIKEWLRTAP